MLLERRHGQMAAYVTHINVPVPAGGASAAVYRQPITDCDIPQADPLTLGGGSKPRTVLDQGLADRRSLMPKFCTGSIFQGAAASPMECLKITVERDRGRTSIGFLARDPKGTGYAVQAIVNNLDVLTALSATRQSSSTIEAFFVQEANSPPTGKSPRWPLQGSCTVSNSSIECKANDVVGGFSMSARL